MSKQVFLLKKYLSDSYIILDDTFSSESLSNSYPESNSLYQFNLSYFNAKNLLTGDPVTFDNGDDIAICETSELTAIADDIKLGCIFEKTMEPIGYDMEIKYDLIIEQREFSKYPFRLSPLSFDDNSMYQNLSTVLDLIFTNENTRDDLGGILSSGIVIPKYVLLSPDLEIEIPDQIDAITREHLSEILNPISYKWGVVGFSEPHPTKVLNVIYQVQIWQD